MPALATDPVLGHAAAAALAIVLLAGAWHKLVDLDSFGLAVERYRLLAPAAARATALSLPPLEAFAGLLLLHPASRGAGAALAAAVLLLVTGAVVINLMRGRRDIDCGCGAPGSAQRLSWILVARNAALLGMCALAVAPKSPRELVWLDGFTTAFAALALWAVYGAINELFSDPQRFNASRTES
jgi:hypothetical protein